MEDRVPQKPGRVLVTPENGGEQFYAVITRADEPLVDGTPLNANTLLKDATAARFGLGGENAIPDKAFDVMAGYILAGGLTSVTVLTEDGSPIPGVTLSGVVGQDGGEVTTDSSGLAICVVKGDVDVTFVSHYMDIPDYTQTLTPNFESTNEVTVTMPYIESGTVLVLTESSTVKTFKDRTVSAAIVGGGTGGQGGQGGMSSGKGNTGISNGKYGSGGTGGAGGKVYNVSLTFTAGEENVLVIGAGGTGGAASAPSTSYDNDEDTGESDPGGLGTSGGTTTLTMADGTVHSSASGGATTVPLSDSTIMVGGKGGNGGHGAKGYNHDSSSAESGTSGTRAGGDGGVGGMRDTNCLTYSAGSNGGTGGGGGGGGGGGSSIVYTYAYRGGIGGNGGSGALVVKL